MVFIGILALLTLIWLFGRSGGGGGGNGLSTAALIGTGPAVVIVTVIDPKADPAWVQKIKQNREDYAKRHGSYTNHTSCPFLSAYADGKILKAT